MAGKQGDDDSSINPVVLGTQPPATVSGREMLRARSRTREIDAGQGTGIDGSGAQLSASPFSIALPLAQAGQGVLRRRTQS
jgi:hypothetical protein